MKNQAEGMFLERTSIPRTNSGRMISGTTNLERTLLTRTSSGKTLLRRALSRKSLSRRALSGRALSRGTILGKSISAGTQNRAAIKKKQMQKRRRRRMLCAGVACSIFIVAIVFSLVAMNANAKTADSPTTMYKYYASVQIMNGDSLWSIAEEYTDGSVSEILHCIEEIKSINHLGRSDKIKAGEFLIVPYYSEDIF